MSARTYESESQVNSPARMFALVIGAILVIAGIIGFIKISSFNVHDRYAVLGFLDVNGVSNLVHVVTGVLGLLAATSLFYSKQYSLLIGLVYLAVGVWGFAVGDGHSIIKLLPVDTEENVLHVAIGALGVLMYGLSGGMPRRAAAKT